MIYAALRSTVVAGAAVLSIGIGGAALASTEWDLPLAWPDGNFHVENARTFAKVVGQVTGGELVINIHPGGALGFKGPEMLTAVRDGLVPIGDLLLIQQTGERRILGLEAQPYMTRSLDELAVLHKHFRPVVDEVAQEYNQKVLYMVPWPRQYVHVKREISALDDLRGIKIRTYDRVTTEMFNRVGMTSVQLPWGEVVPALAAGTIDAVTTSASSGVDGKFWEFLTHFYPTNHVWSSNIVTVNLDAWNRLDPVFRERIEQAADLLQPVFWEISKAEDEIRAGVLEKRGMTKGPVADEMLATMTELTAPMREAFITEVGPRAQEVIEAYLTELGRM